MSPSSDFGGAAFTAQKCVPTLKIPPSEDLKVFWSPSSDFGGAAFTVQKRVPTLKIPPSEDLKVFRSPSSDYGGAAFTAQKRVPTLKIPPREDLKVFCGLTRWLFSNPSAKVSKFLQKSIRRHSSGLRPLSLT